MFLNVNGRDSHPEWIADLFLESYKEIKERFKLINKNVETHPIEDSLTGFNLIIDLINKLADMLYSDQLFHDEFMLSISIIADLESMIYLDVLKENMYYIANVVINFCKLISIKQDWILSNKNFNYEQQYEDFTSFYIAHQCNFLRTLPRYDENNEDDEAIVRVANMLW